MRQHGPKLQALPGGSPGTGPSAVALMPTRRGRRAGPGRLGCRGLTPGRRCAVGAVQPVPRESRL